MIRPPSENDRISTLNRVAMVDAAMGAGEADEPAPQRRDRRPPWDTDVRGGPLVHRRPPSKNVRRRQLPAFRNERRATRRSWIKEPARRERASARADARPLDASRPDMYLRLKFNADVGRTVANQ